MLRVPRFHLDRLPAAFFHSQGEAIWRDLEGSFLDLRRGCVSAQDLCERVFADVLRANGKPLWRGVPGPAREVLDFWRANPEILIFSEDVFDPWEVVRLQCDGRRCVTLFTDLHSWLNPASREKDPIAFLIHDLVHAQRFFLGPIPLEKQIEASRAILRARGAGLLAGLELDERIGLDYVISDMNTHPAHQAQGLAALELRRRKRARGVSRLGEIDERDFTGWKGALSECFGELT